MDNLEVVRQDEAVAVRALVGTLALTCSNRACVCHVTSRAASLVRWLLRAIIISPNNHGHHIPVPLALITFVGHGHRYVYNLSSMHLSH